MSTLRATNLQHASAASPAIVLAADGTATATVSAINGGPLAGMRNAIINGNFDVWQRGTTFGGVVGYGADRWRRSFTGSSVTMSRQNFVVGQADVPGGPNYFCRMAVTSVAGASNYALMSQAIEGVKVFAGQQITISFWAKADAARTIALEFVQAFGSGGSPSSAVLAIGSTKKALTTSWQRISHTVTLPSVAGKTLGTDGNDNLNINLWFDAGSTFNSRTDTLGQQSGTFDIAQVQVEAGPVATPFESRPISLEYELCKKYFQYLNTSITVGSISANTQILAVQAFFIPEMRATPTVTYISGTQTAFAAGAPSMTGFDTRGFVAWKGATAAPNYNANWSGFYSADAEL